MSRARSVPRILLFPLLFSCLSCAVFTSKSDYADYRKVRLARDQQERLAAMKAYLQRRPNGYWFPEVWDSRAQIDGRVFDAQKGSRAGLQNYLRVYPDGTYAVQARARLKALERLNERRIQERDKKERILQEREALEGESRKTWVTRFFTYWIRVLLSISNWGSPIDEVARSNAAFSKAFGQAPVPYCSSDQCVKRFTSRYAIPIPSGTRIERSIEIDLRLSIKQGRLVSAQILLPKRGFSRWFELENGLVCFDEDVNLRQKAASWALEKTEMILREVRKAEGLIPVKNYQLETIRPLATREDDKEEESRASASPEEGEDAMSIADPVRAFFAGPLEVAIFTDGADGSNSDYNGIEIRLRGDKKPALIRKARGR